MPSKIKFHSFKKKPPRQNSRLPRQDLGLEWSLWATALNDGARQRACADHEFSAPQHRAGLQERSLLGKAGPLQDAECTHVPLALRNPAPPPQDSTFPAAALSAGCQEVRSLGKGGHTAERYEGGPQKTGIYL